MNNGKNYKVVLQDGERVELDHKVFKTLDGALKRLGQLVQSEELRLMAGFGRKAEYHITAC